VTEVYLGLGSNMGDRRANLRRALGLLAAAGVGVTRTSPVYETAPVGYGPQRKFLNAVCMGETWLEPLALLRAIKEIEAALGRAPGPRNGPRPMDVDILLYGELCLATPELTVPHPRLAERAFVLAPLADLAPDLAVPGLGKRVRELLAEAPGREGVRAWKEAAGRSRATGRTR
jgi:2-amino-4-hydroxy-6-hydroxymethyldihydropteridine diphosphokinase